MCAYPIMQLDWRPIRVLRFSYRLQTKNYIVLQSRCIVGYTQWSVSWKWKYVKWNNVIPFMVFSKIHPLCAMMYTTCAGLTQVERSSNLTSLITFTQGNRDTLHRLACRRIYHDSIFLSQTQSGSIRLLHFCCHNPGVRRWQTNY